MSKNGTTNGVKLQTNIKAGLFDVFRKPKPNHNETLVSGGRGMKISTGIRAGKVREHR